jgi:GalNAc-alpha-(1->4)-GalNAc-alpha-(1->3)-diNAcBac-PP-undecaprenol alpha-1,4-N-acetyl-D-galactosaminyltransferase
MNRSTKRLKCLFVIDSLNTGGAQRQLVNLTLGLTQRGYQVELFCYAPGDLLAKPLYDAGIQIHWYIKRSRFSFGVILALNDLINKGQYNLVLSFLPTPNFYTILTGRILRLNRIPVIVSERRGDVPGGPRLLTRFSRQFYRLATRVVTNSHHQRIDLVRNYPWLQNRLSTIYNGYDLSYLIPELVQPDNHPLHMLTIAHVTPYKNGLCLVEAMNLLRTRDGLTPQVDWLGELIMKGKPLEYLNEMKRKIEEYRLEKDWTWLNQRTDIVDQLHQHDVLVHPSYGEGLPNVVCEALACARPVIVSDLLDHSQLVQNGKSGYLFNHMDPSDLAEKIKMFIRLTPDERKKMGMCGREYAEANLSIDRLTDDYERLFMSMINQKE